VLVWNIFRNPMLRNLAIAVLSLSPVGMAFAQQQSALSDAERQAMREAASVYWSWSDSGDIPADFPTSPEVCTCSASFWWEGLMLFNFIYADRLDGRRGFGIEELIEQDEKVRDAFRWYTLTGELKSNAITDPDGFMKQWIALQDAMFVNDKFDLENLYSFVVDGGELKIRGFKLSTSAYSPPPVPVPVPIIPPNLPDDIREFWEQVRREWEALHMFDWFDKVEEPDGMYWWGNNGIECDDFADMLAAWYLRRLGPEAAIENAWAYWWKDGHVVLVIHYRGYTIVIDPQTGHQEIIQGDVTDEYIYKFICRAGYFQGRNCDDIPWLFRARYRKPFDHPWTEPAPWWEDPDNVDRLRQKLPPGVTPEDMIPTPTERENLPVWVP